MRGNEDNQKQKLQRQQEKFEQQLFKGANSIEQNQTAEQQQRQQREKEVKEQINKHREKEAEEQTNGQQKKRAKVNKKRRQSTTAGDNTLFYLYDTKEAHPIMEYIPSKEDAESATLTPSFVLEVTWPRIVQFYHPLSPRCQELQESYVSIARGIRRRSSRLPVEFHAVNCGIYREVCEARFGIKSVPTIIGLRSGRIEWMEISLTGSLGSLDGTISNKEDTAKDVALSVEHIAHVMQFTLDVVKKGHAGAAFARSSVGIDGHSPLDESPVGGFVENEFPGGSSISYDSSIPLEDQVFHDAKSSLLSLLTSSLYSQLPSRSALPRDTAKALSEFLDLIRWAFPPETKVHDLAEDLHLDFKSVTSGEDGLLKVLERHMILGKEITWSSGCSAQAKGGYSCGIWSLLHILSIGVAERHASVVGDADTVSVNHAGQVMRSFIDKFFIGCNSCRELWIELYDEACCGASNTDNLAELIVEAGSKGDEWRNLSICIWKVHNEVTIRRQQSKGKGYYREQSRMASASSLWPRKEDCPGCWESLTDDTGQMLNMDSYDRKEIYDHLNKRYWPDGVHNNRLIVLGRWSKAKRALSIKRLRARMASHQWPISVLILHVLVGWCILRIIFPRWSQHIMKMMFSRSIRERDIQRRKKMVKMAKQSHRNGRPPHDRNGRPSHPNGRPQHIDDSGWVRNRSSVSTRSRQSMNFRERTGSGNGNFKVSQPFQRSHEGSRLYSGARSRKQHSFNHFLEL